MAWKLYWNCIYKRLLPLKIPPENELSRSLPRIPTYPSVAKYLLVHGGVSVSAGDKGEVGAKMYYNNYYRPAPVVEEAPVDFDSLRHVPEEVALEKMDHALGHELLILLPVRLGYLGPDWNSVLESLVGLPGSRLRMCRRGYRSQHQGGGQKCGNGG